MQLPIDLVYAGHHRKHMVWSRGRVVDALEHNTVGVGVFGACGWEPFCYLDVGRWRRAVWSRTITTAVRRQNGAKPGSPSERCVAVDENVGGASGRKTISKSVIGVRVDAMTSNYCSGR